MNLKQVDFRGDPVVFKKLCRGCWTWYPATTEYFYRKNINDKWELQSRCKKCGNQAQREYLRNLSPEKHEAHLLKKREYQANLSPEQHEAYLRQQKEYRANMSPEQREARNQRVRKIRSDTRLKVLDKLGGRFCLKCEGTDIRVLTIDHIHGGGKKDRKKIGSGLAFYRYILSLPDEEARVNYQVLCRHCNWIKRLEVDGR